MAQHDYVIDNQSFPATRTDINNVLLAISSTNSGTSAPSTTYANQLWYDTSENKLYIRNEDNDQWISLFLLDQSNDVASTLATQIDVEDASGTDTAGTALTIKGGAGTGAGAGGSIVFQTADGGSSGSSVNAHATQVTILDNGRVGIGTSTPQANLDVTIPSATSTETEMLRLTDGVLCDLKLKLNRQSSLGTSIAVMNTAAGNIAFETSNSERMRIDSSGRLLVNATIPLYTGSKAEIHTDGSSWTTIRNTDATTAQQFSMVFARSSSTVGSINTTNTSTIYVTSSDYRLKENVTGITDGIQRIKQLNPSRFNFIADPDTTVDGFLAHEAQTVVPESVTGTHNETEVIGDITDADNNPVETGVVEPDTLEDGHTWTETGTQPVYQGIDQAKLVPLLTAALQEAIAKIEALETRVAALEG